MCEETKRKCSGGYETVFSYGDGHLSLNEMLEKPEVLNYLRRNGRESSRQALRKRLREGRRKGEIRQKIIMEYAQRTKPIPAPRTKSPPRTKPIPAPRAKRPPRTKPIPIPRTILRKIRPIPPPRTRVKPIPPPRNPRTKPIPPPRTPTLITKYEKAGIIGKRAREIADGAQPRCSVEGLTSSLDIATREFEQGLTVFRRRPEPRPKKEYIPVSPSEVDFLSRKNTSDQKLRNETLKHLDLLEE